MSPPPERPKDARAPEPPRDAEPHRHGHGFRPLRDLVPVLLAAATVAGALLYLILAEG
jgi:hypothetical protein